VKRVLTGLLLLAVIPAMADGFSSSKSKDPKPQPTPSVNIDVEAEANAKSNSNSKSKSNASSGADATSGSSSSATGGAAKSNSLSSSGDSKAGASASNDGVTVAGDTVLVSNSDYVALALDFPAVEECWNAAQGGKDSGFLGIRWVSQPCLVEKLSAGEKDIRIRAHLKCANKHYRNALAYDIPNRKKERTAACIEMKVASDRGQLDAVSRELLRDVELLKKQRRRLQREADYAREIGATK
jgi:hypothetical protein